MVKYIIFNVIYRKDEWHVVRARTGETEGRFSSKADAIERGRELAMREEMSQLRVKKMDGSIQSELTFGKDPRLIEG